jgi:hypothetical protein
MDGVELDSFWKGKGLSSNPFGELPIKFGRALATCVPNHKNLVDGLATLDVL